MQPCQTTPQADHGAGGSDRREALWESGRAAYLERGTHRGRNRGQQQDPAEQQGLGVGPRQVVDFSALS